ncbi:bifunctional 4-hydroxy-2-oxoglutarate aldolase/2-dehydro-3-deoxy-phosphogluconate aldolase [Natronobacterium gregoryi]|uniref:2-dehydro-3-deoxyphosphogluconate aldolase n=2 Tax=Natronobacterium gregoryi TaxID=44930 RepID=L0AKG8_NATGS|nr:bifunctional 4-hydroxy-2-oxoglutarate aldolase/2-dehydro-3-deoxy-phosphogluconate aldolase [Natronobacterium gregoryi]AFZ73647.1 Entner-Doudoroff aldolase [Natronobacterium gregoryi SP2]ELY67841.1 2-dehydro-3-deoxyphosphogluconate aldolase/4-hydroxy-2-oxoglutarate aldolase [Natronobacterium gregoryi SP2]PLK19630.1 2-dehydro-3-deoxyphosphogluconate aldolase [Natronobacterium gregoryi SP2]SFJ00188.1 2-keto-3-deoxy-phosphogluconate aldolase [Natronobacterium gregoryi]
MVSPVDVRQQLEDSGIVAVLRGIDDDRIVPVARAVHEAGVGAIEVTASEPRVGEKIAAVDEALANTDAVVGAGTVLDAPTARTVIDAGAEFVLAPDVDPDVVRTCNRHGVLSGPGVMTPTEAVTALEAGADVLKLFPATTVGPGHVGAIQGPFGDVPVIPTGGIGPDNVAAFFEAGAFAVGIGSSLVDYDAIEADDMEQVRRTAETVVEAVADARP